MPRKTWDELVGAKDTVEAAEAAAETVEQQGSGSIDLNDIKEFKKAEQEVKQLLAEEEKQKTGLTDGLGQMMKTFSEDDEMRDMFKQYLKNGGSPMSQPDIGNNDPEVMGEHPDSTPPPSQGDVSGQDSGGELADGEYPMSAEDVHAVLESAIGDIASMKPDMTAEEMESHATDNKDWIISEIEKMLETAYEGN